MSRQPVALILCGCARTRRGQGEQVVCTAEAEVQQTCWRLSEEQISSYFFTFSRCHRFLLGGRGGGERQAVGRGSRPGRGPDRLSHPRKPSPTQLAVWRDAALPDAATLVISIKGVCAGSRLYPLICASGWKRGGGVGGEGSGALMCGETHKAALKMKP